MRPLPVLLLALLLGSLGSAAPAAAARHLAIIVDTSGSMQGNDPQRYTMQLSQILSDLVDSGDALSVIRMPAGAASCSDGPSSSLVLTLDPADRAGFKLRLDRLIQFDSGTEFAAPIRTAISLLPRDPGTQRMLLIIADAGGLGACEDELTRELLQLKGTGVTIAAINLGGTAGAFDTNPAFDFRTPALDAQGLIEAVAQVYQKFLGAKKVQTGEVHGEIEVEIAPFVNEAFLVVAADGPIAGLELVPGHPGDHPGSGATDLNHRGGGETRGLDGQLRVYRIARLSKPAAGRWRFRVRGLGGQAGWMLLQDSSIGARLVSSPVVPKGVAVPLEVELYDQNTGRKITDTSQLPGLQVTLDVGGHPATFRDDGQGGDRQAGDGILTATTTFDKVGNQPLPVHIQSNFLDRQVPLTAQVIEAAWKPDVKTPRRTEVDRPVELAVTLTPIGSLASLKAPERIDVLTGGPVLTLRDDGKGKDRQAGDRTYTGTWTPRQTGTMHLDYVPVGGSVTPKVSVPLEVLGRLRFGRLSPVGLGRAGSDSETVGQLDLGPADVRGEFEVKVTTPFDLTRSVLEIDLGDPGAGWVPLGSTPQTLRLAEGGRRTWPVRLRVGGCPEASPAGRNFDLVLEATGADGRPIRATVPIQAVVVADPWLHCWWPVLALAAGLLVAAVVAHGYWSPSRFPPRLGVVLSPEEDIGEGFFHPIRAQRGSRSGFYRDARIYIGQDFRLSGRPRNALARLRADRKLVRIEAAGGAAVWRQNADGVWEPLPPGESTARFGDLYKNDAGTLFFELRNA